MKIGSRQINNKSEVFIVAEISANHGGSIDIAKKSIEAAKNAGADAVKIQTYTPDTITLNVKNEYFKINHGSIWDGQYLYDLYNSAHTPFEWHKELFDFAKSIGILIFSTPFDKTAVDLLDNLNTPAYKIASAEIMDTGLINYVVAKGKPVIFSTGMAYIHEIKEAIDISKKHDNNQIAVLKCVSAYPAPIEESNLLTIPNLRETFDVIVGLSDHSLGNTSAIVATALGARIIEKHFILDKSIGGPDSSFSLDYLEFSEMVKSIRDAEKSLGKITYDLTEKSNASRKHARSLFVVSDILKGDVFTKENVKSIRPGFGLSPKYYNQILGKKAIKKINKGTPLKWDMIK